MSDEPALPDDETSITGTRGWPHSPPHRLAGAGVYFVTARTRNARHLLATDALKDWFQSKLLELFGEADWQVEAWAVLSNHYHVVAHSPSTENGAAANMKTLIKKLHALATMEWNKQNDGPNQSRLWHNYRETHLTFQNSYLARLNYVHNNPTYHGLVQKAADYKWCSATRFEESVTPAWAKTIASFKFDEIAKQDGE